MQACQVCVRCVERQSKACGPVFEGEGIFNLCASELKTESGMEQKNLVAYGEGPSEVVS